MTVIINEVLEEVTFDKRHTLKDIQSRLLDGLVLYYKTNEEGFCNAHILYHTGFGVINDVPLEPCEIEDQQSEEQIALREDMLNSMFLTGHGLSAFDKDEWLMEETLEDTLLYFVEDRNKKYNIRLCWEALYDEEVKAKVRSGELKAPKIVELRWFKRVKQTKEEL